MVKEVPTIREQFCKAIDYEAQRYTCDFISSFESDIQLYNCGEKYKFIHSQRKKIRKNMESSGYKTTFPLKDIEMNLTVCLERFCDSQLIFLITSTEYNKSHNTGKYVLAIITKYLMINSFSWGHGREPVFDLSRLADFKFLSLHIAWGRWFSELNRLEDQYKNEKIVNTENTLPEMIHPVEKWSEDLNSKPISQPCNPSKSSVLFKEGGYELFYYLKEEYIKKEDKSPKAKYSNIYHFLKYHNLMACTQLAYIDFIESEMKVSLSKILSVKVKYSDIVLPVLSQLKSEFDKKKKLNC